MQTHITQCGGVLRSSRKEAFLDYHAITGVESLNCGNRPNFVTTIREDDIKQSSIGLIHEIKDWHVSTESRTQRTTGIPSRVVLGLPNRI